jgi:hypothetical protein
VIRDRLASRQASPSGVPTIRATIEPDLVHHLAFGRRPAWKRPRAG